MKKLSTSVSSIKFARLIISATFVFATANTGAATVVDTDVIPCDGTSCSGRPFSVDFNPDSEYAGRFTLGAQTTITDMHVWMSTFFTLNTTFTMVLYGDALTVPDASNELFSQSVSVIDTGIEDNFNNQWQGLTGLNISLGAGSYWFGVKLSPGDDYAGSLPTGAFGALNPVDTYAFYSELNGRWIEDPTGDFAFRINGEVAAVPVPAALYLFLSGLSLFAVRLKPGKKNR